MPIGVRPMLWHLCILPLLLLPAENPGDVGVGEWSPAGFHVVGGEDAPMVAPQAIVVDFYGLLYVGGGVSGRLIRVDPRFEEILEFDVREARGRFSVADLALHGFYLYLIEERRPRLLRFSNRGNFTDVLLNFSTPDNPDRGVPAAIDVDSSGRILLVYSSRHEIVVLNPFLDPEITFGEFGSHQNQLNSPMGIAHHPDGYYVVSDTGNRRLVKYDFFGEPLAVGVADELESPGGIDIAPDGTVAVADPSAGRVFLFDSSLEFLGTLPLPENVIESGPRDVAFAGNGLLYAADPARGGIQVWRRANLEE